MMIRIFSRRLSSVQADFEPHSVIKIISRSKPYVEKATNKKVKDEGCRVNDMGIQLISEKLLAQIFTNSNLSKENQVDPKLIKK